MKLERKEILPLAAIALSILILSGASFNALSNSNGDALMVGWKAIFGGEVINLGIDTNARVLFNFGNFVAYFLPLIITVAAYFVGRKRKENRKVSIILGGVSVLVFLVSLLLFTVLNNNTLVIVQQMGLERVETYQEAALGVSPILGLILAIFGMGVSAFHTYFQIKK